MKGSFDGMKSRFLGGMRDNESWGLRKWLSKNGGAMKICNDIELIWGALRDLPRTETTTRELADALRPKAKRAFEQLVNGVPKAYQEISNAHPYLPFFHRLEGALRNLSEFDPDDDGIIVIDDSDDDDVQEIQPPCRSRKPSKTNNVAFIDVTKNENLENNKYRGEHDSYIEVGQESA